LGGLIFLQDAESGQPFLVDTGAAVSVLPHRSAAPPTGPPLTGADGNVISSWGKVTKKLVFGMRTFLCSFILAAVSKPILGIDFLAAHRLLVDPSSRSVLCAETLRPLGALCSAVPSKFAASVNHIAPAIRSLISLFPGIVGTNADTPRPLHGVRHHVETRGPPVFAKARRLDPDKLRIAEEEFRSLEKAGIIRRSNSPWSSPLHMVPKPDGSWRPCGDYRRLNTVTTPDRYPLPSILDLSSKLHGCTVFSCVDLVKGYHQIPMSAADVEKTAIVTPFGLFEYIFMPFGLSNAAQTFQRLMDGLFRKLPFVFTYLDDHLIASKSMEAHEGHLKVFFQVLQENGLVINPAKCVFGASSLKFLGHLVDSKGITPLPKHVAAVQDFLPPRDVKQLQRYLGLINFYRRFLPGIAGILQPLTDLLRGSPKELLWSPAAAAAFEGSKAALVAAVPLSHPAPGAVLSLATDASDSHVGGVLQQRDGGGWRPLAFYSKKLSQAEVKYSTFDRELLAAYAAIRHFRFLLEGRVFFLQTDHKPLVSAMVRVSPPWSARVQRHLAFISEFTTDVRYLPGPVNVVADALSRPPEAVQGSTATSVGPPGGTEISALDFRRLAVAQQTCPEVKLMCESNVLSVVSQMVGGEMLLGDMSTGRFRPLLPPEFRAAACAALHGVHHPGVRGTRKLVCASFCWPKMSNFAGDMAKNCMFCQKAKVYRHVALEAVRIPVPQRRFEHIHVDIVGPLPMSCGFNYIFTVLDRTSRWPEAIPLSSITAGDCADALFRGWVQRFGLPNTITSDRGAQFTSSVWAHLCKMLDITHSSTTAYHPQSNGLVERFHRRLKDALRARAAGAEWYHHLPWVMLGIRSAWREGADFTPAESVYGAQPILPGQYMAAPESPSPSFLEDLQSVLGGRPPLATQHKSAAAPVELPADLLGARFVLVRRDGVQPPLSPKYDGPYLVLQRSLHTFKLQMGDRVDVVSTLRLKACHAPPDTVAAVPPRRGRPPLILSPPAPATSGLVSSPATPGGGRVSAPATSGAAPATSGKTGRLRVRFLCAAAVMDPAPPSRAGEGERPRRCAQRPLRYQ